MFFVMMTGFKQTSFIFVFISNMSNSYEQLKKITQDRHSVRAFDGKPIEKGVLEEILGYSLVRCSMTP